MALIQKPSKLPRWADTVTGDPAYIQEPAEGRKDTGWPVGKPERVYMNWLQNLFYQWILYFQSRSDAYSQEYDAIVNTTDSSKGTHATLKLALADAAILDGMKILVVDNQTVNTSPVLVDKAVEIVFKPFAGLSAGTSTNGMNITASGARVKGGLFSGFTGYAINIASGASRVKVGEVDFQGNTTDVNDLNGNAAIYGSTFSS